MPGVAQGAIQGGRHVAAQIERTLRGEPRQPFRYRDKGVLSTIGRARAVGLVGKLHLTGFTAWLTWLFVHIMFLVGFRNRLAVVLEAGLQLRHLGMGGAAHRRHGAALGAAATSPQKPEERSRDQAEDGGGPAPHLSATQPEP